MGKNSTPMTRVRVVPSDVERVRITETDDGFDWILRIEIPAGDLHECIVTRRGARIEQENALVWPELLGHELLYELTEQDFTIPGVEDRLHEIGARLHTLFTDHEDSHEMRAIAYQGLRIGRLIGEIQALRSRQVRAGRGTATGGKNGARTTNADRAKRKTVKQAEAERIYRSFRSKGCSDKFTPLCDRVGRKMGLSGRTIRGYLAHMKKS